MFIRLLSRTLPLIFTPTPTLRILTRTTRTTTTTMPPPLHKPKPTHPLVVITGPTGTGKSLLAISLAQSLLPRTETEIINCDAMQLYTGLPVITNKVSPAEQQGIDHHLLGTIGLGEETWTVKKFVGECDAIIGRVRERGNVPILVGGTGYYVHGVLVGGGVLDGDGEKEEEDDGERVRASEGWAGILDGSTEEIYEKLMEIDPVMAGRWHPSDRRKIQRSLEIYLKTGRKASEVYAEQRRDKADVHEDEVVEGSITLNKPGRLRHDALIFWLDAEDAALKERLNKRVDSMVHNGLIEEAQQMAAFEREMKQRNMRLDKTKGIWVSIGYKELEPWLEHVQSQSEEAKSAVALQQSCIEAVKASTRRYAKRQNRYIRIRLNQALAAANASDKLFLLDCTDIDEWQRKVVEPARDIVDSFLAGGQLPRPADLSGLARKTFEEMSYGDGNSADRVARKCETCNKILMTEKEWLKHLQSRSHKKVLEGIRRRSLNHDRRGVTSNPDGPKVDP